MILTAEDIGDKHRYIKDHLPDFRMSESQIKNLGGPWPCKTCKTASLLDYRCSACGADLMD